MSHQHKAGTLKQSNKSHKGSQSSKRSVKRSFGAGKVESVRHVSKKVNSTSNMALEAKFKRTQRDAATRKLDRMNIWLQKRLGSVNNRSPPKVITFVPLSHAASEMDMISSCTIFDDETCVLSQELPYIANKSTSEHTHMMHNVTYNSSSSKYKMKCTYIQPKYDLMSIIEAVKISDIVVYILHVQDSKCECIDATGHTILSALKTYGTNQCVACITGILDTIPSNTTPNNIRLKSQELKSLASRMANSFITTNIKVIDYNVNTQNQLNRNSSNNQLLRYVNETIPHVSTNIIGDHSSNHTTTAGGSSVNSNVTTWRRDRSFMIIEECNPITETNTDLNVDSGDIVIKGYLRNKPLYINSLLHVVNVGTGAIKSVKLLNSTTGDSAQIKMSDASLQDSLKLMASPDYLQGEQTWPMENEEYSDEYLNEEGLAGIEGQGVDMNDESKPTDGYHDEWFEDENEDERIRKEAQVGGDLLDDVNSVAGSMVRENKYKSNLTSANLLGLPAKGKVNKKELLTQEILDRFQDEVDVPEMPMTVRKQFVKYRALQSFKYSDWHPKENLPLDYSKIYEFQQFSITQRRELNKIRTAASLQDTALIKQFDKKKNNVSESNNEVEMKDDETDSAAGPDPNYIPSGEYVEIVLTGLNFEAFQNNYQINGGFSVCYSLFKHENKLSVCHFNITPLPIYQELFCDGGCTNPTKKPDLSNILACKDEVVIQMGIRTPMICNPIYSESNLNCDKHKMSRYLIANSFTTATVFAPVTYLPCPVLVYARRPKTGPGSLMNDVTVTEATCISPVVDHDKNVCMSTQTELVLIATGVLDAVDPDRIILKKAVLTGVPIRVKKRFGVVKYMFNEPQDVKYYQPAELVTKHGLRGHIREPVGTHGLFKAIFSAPVTQNDTVMLVLYKRVFPKLRSSEDTHNTANDDARVSDMDLE